MKTTTKTEDRFIYQGRTALPWTLDEVWMLVKGPNGEEVCAIHSGQNDNQRVDHHVAHSNAELICRAANCHEEMLELLKLAQVRVFKSEGYSDLYVTIGKMITKAEA